MVGNWIPVGEKIPSRSEYGYSDPVLVTVEDTWSGSCHVSIDKFDHMMLTWVMEADYPRYRVHAWKPLDEPMRIPPYEN